MFMYSDLMMLPITAAIVVSIMLLIFFLRRRIKQHQQSSYQEAIQLLILLRHLVASLQKHRGLSTGILRGDKSLTQDLQCTRNQIDDYSDQCAQTSTHLQDNERWISLIDHWSRLRQHCNLDAENNLNQHNHMIRNLIFLIEDLATELNLVAGKPQLSYLPFIWREILQTAEWAGQARALGTGIAAAQQSTAEERIRLRFLRDKIQRLSATAFQKLEQEIQTDSPLSLLPAKTAVDAMLACIEQELLHKEQPDIAAMAYFQNATHTIDVLLTLVDTALKHLQSIHLEGAGS